VFVNDSPPKFVLFVITLSVASNAQNQSVIINRTLIDFTLEECFNMKTCFFIKPKNI